MDDAQVVVWCKSVVVDAGVCGVGVPLLLFMKKNVTLGDLKLPHVASAQVAKMLSWAQHMAQALRKDGLFRKGREQCLQTMMAAGLDGCLAIPDVVRMSHQHPLLTELAVQSTAPTQDTNASFAEHAVAMLLCVEAEAPQH